jgi:phosphatidylinositol glycan class O
MSSPEPSPKPSSVRSSVPKAVPGSYNSIAAQYARAKAAKDAEDKAKVDGIMKDNGLSGNGNGKMSAIETLNEIKGARFKREWGWVVGFFVWLL